MYIIAEIGINSNGSVDNTIDLIDKASDAGCHAVKLQKRTIDIVYTEEELAQPKESPWGTTVREEKEGREFTIVQHKGFEDYALYKGLDYFVSCWDENSVDLVEENLHVTYHKIPSALLTSRSFLEKINSTKKRVIVSTGMSTVDEINEALKILNNVEYILACTSTYPTKDEEVNLNYITTLQELYPDYQIGFSNHSSGLMACYGASAIGAECIEFHITLDRAMYGSDQAASIQNCHDLVSGVNKMQILSGDGIKRVYESEQPTIKRLRRTNDILF